MDGFRKDIQLLRAIAVVAVVLYHARFVPAGYLGVDVFFVISGYLIADLLRRDAAAGRLDYADFFLRRARRLLPAAYLVFMVTAGLAPLFLTSLEMRDFREQIIGAYTLSENFTLGGQQGYFNGASELKPFLHIWSLAVEWQYYLVIPLVFMFCKSPQRMLWLIAAGSLALCIGFAGRELVFYMLPTRAWEMALGSAGAFLPALRLRAAGGWFWLGLALMAALFCVELTAYRPGPEALLICLLTLAIMLLRHDLRADGRLARALQRVGDASYSIYLVHWPVFCFYNNAWLGHGEHAGDMAFRLGLMLLSLAAAFLLHRHVEMRFRHAGAGACARKDGLLRIGAVTVLCMGVSLTMTLAGADEDDYVYRRRPMTGLGDQCRNFQQASGPACRDVHPDVLIWGDSNAMHLVDGLVAEGYTGLVQATRSFCGPFPGVAMLKKGEDWARSCMAFNDDVLRYALHSGSIRTVILSSLTDYVVESDSDLLARVDGGFRKVPAVSDAALESLSAVVKTLTAKRIRVVFFTPPPSSGYDSSRCIERMQRALWSFGGRSDCAIPQADYQDARRDTLRFVELLEDVPGLNVVRLDRFLCDGELCRTQIDGVMLYRDRGHLSHAGSDLLGRKMSWSALIGH